MSILPLPPPEFEAAIVIVLSLALLAVIVKFVVSVESRESVVPSTVKAPELISTAPVVVISTSAALPSIFTPAAPSSVKAPVEVVKLEAAAASTLTPAEASTVKAPELISTAPVVVMSTSAALPSIFTPAAPLSVKAPTEVVKLEAAAASKLKPAPASTVIELVAFKSRTVESKTNVVPLSEEILAALVPSPNASLN